jgi:hypothetical protein
MPRRIGRRRPGAVGETAASIPGIAAFAFLPAVAGSPAVQGAALPYLAIIGYLLTLVFLVVFGIWGFRLGSGRLDEGNGGGSQGPDDKPAPPPGGRELTEDFPAWEEQLGTAEHEPAAARRG